MNTTDRIDALLTEWCDTDDCEKRDEIAGEIKKLAALAPPSGEGVGCWLFEEMYVTQWADPAKGIEGSVAWRPGSSVEYPTTLVAQKWARNVRPCYTTPQSAPVDGDAVQQALLVINDAENDARHRGDYARANALVKARVTLYRASATPPPASQERGYGKCQKCGAPTDPTWGHIGDCKSPSSAAEASINSHGIDSKLIPDAAEQTKPVACDCGNDQIECFGRDGRGWLVGCKPCSKRDGGREHVKGRTREEAVRKWNAIMAEQAKPAGDDAIREQYRDGTFTRYFGAHPSEQAQAGEDALSLAIEFHNTYERLAPDFGYETRADTKQFDPTTPNGKLMVAVCATLLCRLAGGVTVDDAMVRRFADAVNPLRFDLPPPSVIRNAMVAALGAGRG